MTGFFCQPVGHTFNELDQSFNTLIVKMLQSAIYTISTMVHLIRKFLAPYGIMDVRVLPHLFDIKAVEESMHSLGGYATSQYGSGMHEFRLQKDAEGVVRLKMRKSSKASGWIPEGAGYVVFKTDPPRKFEPAGFKPDSAWSRTQVEATLHQWFRFMALLPVERAGAEAEWTGKCFELPIDMQPHQLPPDQILSTPDLPTRSWVAGQAERMAIYSAHARLENPEVNPTHGHGRSAGEVSREAQAYREAARANATGVAPTFQSDYILVQLPGSALALHQVCNGALLERATAKDQCFTTVEYVHNPQPGVSGFFGTFEKKLNPTFNAMDPKSGTKFVRHSGITRERIVVYNVQTWLDASQKPKVLRVAPARGPSGSGREMRSRPPVHYGS